VCPTAYLQAFVVVELVVDLPIKRGFNESFGSPSYC